MDLRDKALYHQIHQLKLSTDISTAMGAAVLLWRHHLVWALLAGFIPSILASACVIRVANPEPYRRSRAGRYVARHMTRGRELARFIGLALFWAGAWHRAWLPGSQACP